MKTGAVATCRDCVSAGVTKYHPVEQLRRYHNYRLCEFHDNKRKQRDALRKKK